MKKPSSKPLVALHLSDIHFGQEKGEAVEINEDARNQLVLKVAQIAKDRAAAMKAPIGSIIITGDIAYSGKKEQFDEAVLWLERLSDAAGCDRLAVQTVPGNHDVDRGSSIMVASMIEGLFRYGVTRLNKILGSPDDCGALYNRMKEYQGFANGYGCKLETNGGCAGIKEHVLAPGRTLRLLGLNSALLCCGKENAKKPKLLLGARQRVIPEIPGVEYVILVHHPMAWLRDGADTQRYIDNRARVLMCGHEHKPNVSLRTTQGNGKLLIIDAGATVPDKITKEYTYTFNVIEIDLADPGDAIDVTVDPYKWNDGELRFHQDKSDHIDGAPQTFRLACPKFGAEPNVAETAGSEAAERSSEAPAEESEEEKPMIEAIDRASLETTPDSDLLYARARADFFHHLTTPQRIAVLVRLKALPEGIEALSSNLMLTQLERLNSRGRTAELTAAIADAHKA